MDKVSRRSILSFIIPGAILAFVLPRAARAAASGKPGPEKQPHMEVALKQLRAAAAQLAKAIADKGGHRVQAEKYVQQAIAEVEKGIEYANTH